MEDMKVLATAVSVIAIVSSHTGLLSAGVTPEESAAEQCAAAAKAKYGAAPPRIECKDGKCLRGPKRIKYSSPEFPSPWPATCLGTTATHELMIAPDGRVSRIWTVQPGCPELDGAMRTAMSSWEYAPIVVDGAPTPACWPVRTMAPREETCPANVKPEQETLACGNKRLAASCDGDDMEACNKLGWRHMNGKGLPKNPAQAYSLFEKSCAAGLPKGCFNLGLQLLHGDGVPRDESRGRSFLRQACDQGFDKACSVRE